MCGVIGLIYKKEKQDIGVIAAKLLKMLEYRGYDSTGAIFQKEDKSIWLAKDVGAPSKLVTKLEIDKQSGKIFCGQVRWATFGVVNQVNSQPHEVNCKIHAYGAHNGNITNCNELKRWLISEGHNVKSDNDGEMLVHTLEHFFALNTSNIDTSSLEQRKKALVQASLQTFSKMEGSFASVFFDPQYEIMCAIKAGSSLYCGIGYDKQGESFVIASSDLGAVLSLTKILIPIETNEFIIATHDNIEVYNILTGKKIKKTPKRTSLEIQDIQLDPKYKFFMEQEIYSQPQFSKKLIELYTGSFENIKYVNNFYKNKKHVLVKMQQNIKKIIDCADAQLFTKLCEEFLNSDVLNEIKKFVLKHKIHFKDNSFISSLSTFCNDLLKHHHTNENIVNILKFIDAVFAYQDYQDLQKKVKYFTQKAYSTLKKKGKIYVIACGTSYHAAKIGSVFFNEISKENLFAFLPGEFRAQSLNCITPDDIVLLISQSGETKDLIDIVNLIKTQCKSTYIGLIVNNVNSTLAQEKSDVCFPIFCGIEVAVPATKSFTNQIVLLYILALEIAKLKVKNKRLPKNKISSYEKQLLNIPDLISQTLTQLETSIDVVAQELYLEPSIHILSTGAVGIAMEGALKIREVVLNHTQGYEASEFKHGPNTILGVNTVFGIHSTKAILQKFAQAMNQVYQNHPNLSSHSFCKIFKACADYAFDDIYPQNLDDQEKQIFQRVFKEHNFFESMYRNYPLIFVSTNTKTDINLTISQINTHKIRGANIFMFAPSNDLLEDAVKTPPATSYEYKNYYIKLPQTENNLLYMFTAVVALQLLALKMCIKKFEYLDKIEIKDHGVHPDAPKNVSKSITVD